MSKFKWFSCWVITAEILLVAIFNVFYVMQSSPGEDRLYRVEAHRITTKIAEENLGSNAILEMDLSGYETIIAIKEFASDETCSNDYLVEEIGGTLYRIEYQAVQNNKSLLFINGIFLLMVLLTATVLRYVHQKVLRPFHTMSNLSYELAKGNLSAPVKEEKSKLFGRFLWGMDMLREKLEDNKEKELEYQKERKTLILSLSHDIKTPLSSIELYSKALAEELYDTEEKRNEALLGIARNVKEIKGYVDEIVTASREDFLNLEVENGEFYLSEVMEATKVYYKEKLSVIHTEFAVEEAEECLVKGDKNRLIEVLQNIMENAIKYGDGRSICISFGEEEDCKLIHIKNSGCNLKEEEMPNLFDSFYRGSNSHGVKGNGLGLYICKTLMRQMDGEVYAECGKESFAVTVVVRKA